MPTTAAYWTVLVIAAVLTLVNLGTRCDVAYSPVIVWALAGIVYKQMGAPDTLRRRPGDPDDNRGIGLTLVKSSES